MTKLAEMTMKEMRFHASHLCIKGRSKMRKAELQTAIINRHAYNIAGLLMRRPSLARKILGVKNENSC